MSNDGVRQTLDQSRAALGHVFDKHIPAPVTENAVERGGLVIAGDAVAHFHNAAASLG